MISNARDPVDIQGCLFGFPCQARLYYPFSVGISLTWEIGLAHSYFPVGRQFPHLYPIFEAPPPRNAPLQSVQPSIIPTACSTHSIRAPNTRVRI